MFASPKIVVYLNNFSGNLYRVQCITYLRRGSFGVKWVNPIVHSSCIILLVFLGPIQSKIHVPQNINKMLKCTVKLQAAKT